MKSESKDSIGIAFEISGDANKVLTKSSLENERAKKREGKMRLEDHLKRFPGSDWKNQK